SKVLTDVETEAPSAQTQETTGQSASICPSVQSVRENADANGARASVPAQTDRTDGQTPAQATEEVRQSGAGLSPADLRWHLGRPATAWPERPVGRKSSRRRRRRNGRCSALASRS